MKDPVVGQPVQHFLDKEAEPRAALITAVGVKNVIAVSIFYDNHAMPNSVSGVPHIDDPDGARYQKAGDFEPVGYWDYLPSEREQTTPKSRRQPVKA